MARFRKIQKIPKISEKIFYLIDANFLANKFIPASYISDKEEKKRVKACHDWWHEIDAQTRMGKAFIYVPDLCIAEAFKVLSKKYYKRNYFTRSVDFKRAKDSMRNFLKIDSKKLQSQNRKINIHDISTSRDIIIAVDRFNEVFQKNNLQASIVDLIILSTAKYLIDFFHIPKRSLVIVTIDTDLWKGSKKFSDIPTAFNPISPNETACKVFE